MMRRRVFSVLLLLLVLLLSGRQGITVIAQQSEPVMSQGNAEGWPQPAIDLSPLSPLRRDVTDFLEGQTVAPPPDLLEWGEKNADETYTIHRVTGNGR